MPSCRLGQKDFLVGQLTLMATCMMDKGPEKSFANQVIKMVFNNCKHALALGKQNLRVTCLRGKLKFNFLSSAFPTLKESIKQMP